jgi:peroxiredoxin (alkyl hydroperoxide reductase subunit C)
MSLINTTVKPFSADAYKAGKFITVTDADLMGKWSVVFFYPADFTFVCPTELEDLADHYATFRSLGVEIYSISTDTHFAHKAWHDTSESVGKIQYTMVGDPTGTISRNFEVMIEEAGLADRGTFVIDPEGKIQIVEVKAAQYVASHPGEVCPAKWQEGEKTLAPSLDLVGKI